MVGECKGAACTHLHFTVFTTEIYFMGLLVSHQGTGRKCLLPERKSLKLWEIIKLANTVGSADLRGQLLWQSGNRMGTVMWRCKQSYSHWTFYCPDTAECGKHETKMLYVLYLEQYFKCFSPFFLSLSGFEGHNCENNVDDCPGHKCMNGGICVDGVNTYNCQCPPEWTGRYKYCFFNV